ncbi:ABC transporter permease [Amphibacillus cookii]|uniref:ABC transporter permease n=1 Tax=Amphibacillus cookii TaxID=767787 RepID=UPI001956DC72|nr:FtsX-like permease family protein [Amphibacillus cookii]MBM7541177.1 putative ABC transport system permease protein [Amphibacillus cookii]
MSAAEYMYMVTDSAQPVPDHENFGIAWVNEDYFDSIAFNEVMITTEEDINEEQLLQDIEEKSEPSSLLSTTKQQQHVSYNMVDSKVTTIKNMRFALPVLFFLIAAGISFISMGRHIETERSQIAIFKALGTKKVFILIHYLFYPTITTLAGTVIGTAVGTTIFPNVLISTLSVLFSLPDITGQGFIMYALGGFLMALVLSGLATILACRLIFKENPAQALRPKPPKSGKKALIERLPIVKNKLSYLHLLIIRQMTMNKRRFLLSSFGILACTGLTIGALGLKFAFDDVIDTEFNQVKNYDISASLVEPKPIEEIDNYELEDASFPSPYTSGSVTIDRDIETTYHVIDHNNHDINLFHLDQEIDLNDHGIVISEKLATEHNIKVGDTLSLSVFTPTNTSEELDVQVKEVYTSYTSQGIYLTYDYLTANDVTLPVTRLFYSVEQPNHLSELKTELAEYEDLTRIALKRDQEEDYRSGSESINSIILIMIIASIILVIVVLYNISSINIFERRREIATQKVLGVLPGEINKQILTENIILTTLSVLLGMVCGHFIYKWLSEAIIPEEMAFPQNINLMSIPITILIVYVFTLLVNLFLKRRIKKIQMVESLKSVE